MNRSGFFVRVTTLYFFRRMMQRRRQTRARRVWSSAIFLTRDQDGFEARFLPKLLVDDVYNLSDFLRIDQDVFDSLLSILESKLTKKSRRKPISPRLRLIITLVYLSSGTSYHDLRWVFLASHNVISVIVRETCRAIIELLGPVHLKTPRIEAEWRKIGRVFETKWNFKGCIGAIDGKHVVIKKPPNSSSEYFNYKKTCSVNLFAVADGDYKFSYAEVGVNGKISDGGVWRNSWFQKEMQSGRLKMPIRREGDNPWVLVADEAFPLSAELMRPFPRRSLNDRKRIYNYRLSRARRVVENSFGILCNRFRCLLKTMEMSVESVKLITLSCCILHNMLIKNSIHYLSNDIDRYGPNGELIEGDWRNRNVRMIGTRRGAGNSLNEDGRAVREFYLNYFNGEGAVPFQYRVLNQEIYEIEVQRDSSEEENMDID